MMTATTAFHTPTLRQMGMTLRDAVAMRGACSVSLIDRRTGAIARRDGAALIAYSNSPAETAAQLLAGRDPAIWEARIAPLDGSRR